jgi:peroxiredoxin
VAVGVTSLLEFAMTCFPTSGISFLAVPICSCLFSGALFLTAIDSVSAQQADVKEDAPATAETDPDYAVPDGTPDEIFEFVDKLKTRKPKFASRREMLDHIVRMHRAMIDAGDKVLNQETDVKTAVKAAKLKLASLTLLATNQIGDAAKEAMAAASKLRSDERRDVAKAVEPFWISIRIINLDSLTAENRTELTDEILGSVSKSRFSPASVRDASQYGDVLSGKGLIDEAGEFYDHLAKLADESDDPKVQANAKRYEGLARRVRLPGHFMAIEGKLLNGDAIDWPSYRGKVVLVDFWATWCGPCVAELPNVKTNYDKYHEKGFDVVGISLDRSREPLDAFIEKQEIPWAQLYDEEIQNGKGWNHPMAEQFGINAIPAAILVDKEGNVVSLRARGPELTRLLENLLGKSE